MFTHLLDRTQLRKSQVEETHRALVWGTGAELPCALTWAPPSVFTNPAVSNLAVQSFHNPTSSRPSLQGLGAGFPPSDHRGLFPTPIRAGRTSLRVPYRRGSMHNKGTTATGAIPGVLEQCQHTLIVLTEIQC